MIEDSTIEGINPFRFDFYVPWYRYPQVSTSQNPLTVRKVRTKYEKF